MSKEIKTCDCSKKWRIVIPLLVVILIVGVANLAVLFSQPAAVEESCAVDFAGEKQIEQTVPANDPFAEIADDDAVKGSLDAPITIVEFSDFECSFCETFFSQTLSDLETKYIDTGKVRFIYRDFPLEFHTNAQKAAEAAECAGEQGKYYEMHDKIFENQNAIGVNNLKTYAKQIGLDEGEFDVCLDSGAMAQEVAKDFSDGQKLGVSGTPTFFVNGTKLVGAQPLSAFEQIIEAELAK
ncbi:MAG: DsbA family protein [Candidatus Diapherotrites archaeon]|nr:DsbA family protein [Candidatus Diapherotrites archaeon]MBT4596592.1 DsbA family protein [Candidatus Diapherotrites archaeon]